VNLPQIARVETVEQVRIGGGWMERVRYLSIAKAMRVTLAMTAAAPFCAGFGVISTANAQTIGSSYTSTAPKDCRVSGAGNGVDDSATRVCPGKAGFVVLVSEDDLRETVSVGRNRAAAAREPAAGRGSVRSARPPRRSNGARWTASRLRSFSAGTSPTIAMRTRTAGRSPSRCWR
jgi:hypothetical protein